MKQGLKSRFPETGLSQSEAEKRLVQFGRNRLEQKEFFWGKLILEQLKSPLIYILIMAGAVSFAFREWMDGGVILTAVILNTGLGFFQELKAQKTLKSLRNFLVQRINVIRDGRRQRIEAELLVPGDVVILTIGTRVPADGKLLEGKDLSLNEAVLTGESLPVGKKAVPEGKGAKAENKVFAGTIVATGIGKMEVTQTGKETEVGLIGQKVTEVVQEKTPLQEQLAGLAGVLTVLVGLICGIIFCLGLAQGREVMEVFKTSVAVAVAAIPEGLAVTLTVILALGMQRILTRRALVRKLAAAETLGGVTVICADKTGTLTEGKMRVVGWQGNEKIAEVEEQLWRGAVLCNDLRDPLEVGMMMWAKDWGRKKKKEIKQLTKGWARLDEVPFSPETKYIATLHKIPGEEAEQLFFSGAPEVVLAATNLSGKEQEQWRERFVQAAEKGNRLVGFAAKRRKENGDWRQELKDFDWLGVLIFEDPIRKGVGKAMRAAKEAGIKIKVITGDYLRTAAAIFDRLGVRSEPLDAQEMMTGDELERLEGEALRQKVAQVILFARTSPLQKLKIVQALKEQGETVAMMGDGVNDAPALAKADIGIVVEEATDVAKESADMVLLDTRFQTVIDAVEEGRSIFENLKKVIVYLLADSFTELILVGGAMLLGLPLPLTAAQILWVNLAEDTLPNIALAFEPGEKKLMKEPPRSRRTPLLNKEMKVLIFVISVATDFCLLGLFYWLINGGGNFRHWQTIIFATLGTNSLFYVFACRSLREPIWERGIGGNRWLLAAVGISFLILWLAVEWAPLRMVLGTQPLDGEEWGLVFFLGVADLASIELTKDWFLAHKNGGGRE